MSELAKAAMERFQEKRRAYQQTLYTDMSVILSRWAMIKLLLRAIVSPRPAYHLAFRGAQPRPHPAAQVMLDDLKRFCRFNRGGLVVSPVSRMTDSHATAYQNGLRDVYIRILMMSGLDGGNSDGDSHAEAVHAEDESGG